MDTISTTSLTSSVTRARKGFSKQQLLEELSWFIPAWSRSYQRLFEPAHVLGEPPQSRVGHSDGRLKLDTTPFWVSLVALYDYAYDGVLPQHHQIGDGSLADAEMFVMGLEGLESYLAEDDGGVPKLAQQTVLMAYARHVLDGGQPYTEWDRNRLPNCIKVSHLALLARVHESELLTRPDGHEAAVPSLIHTEHGSYVRVEHAQLWLQSVAGYVPTGSTSPRPFTFAAMHQAALPADILRAMNERAAAAGTTVLEVLRDVFAAEITNDAVYASPPTASSSLVGLRGNAEGAGKP